MGLGPVRPLYAIPAGSWRESASTPGILERSISIAGLDPKVHLLCQRLPTGDWHCLAVAGSTLLGEATADRRPTAASQAIAAMLGAI